MFSFVSLKLSLLIKSPVHVKPSSLGVKPESQLQLRLPSVLTHFWSQPPLFSSHSFSSKKKNYQNLVRGLALTLNRKMMKQ